MAAERTATSEKQLQRNCHPDFKQVEASRPPFDTASTFRYTQTPNPNWTFGSGANHLLLADDTSTAATSTEDPDQTTPKQRRRRRRRHISIDPYAPGRPPAFNYKLLISAIVPRPIAFLSTRSADGRTANLAPFSYFSVISHDPPLFTIGIASSLDRSPKDSLRNLVARRECVVNVVGEAFAEAANAASVNAPYGASEWAVAGLTPAYDCETVGCARVREAVFAVEARLESAREFESRAVPGRVGCTLVVVEGTRFWVREDAVNEEGSMVDLRVLRPISRLGGISYGRVTEAFELPRPDFEKDVGGLEGVKKLESSKHLAN